MSRQPSAVTTIPLDLIPLDINGKNSCNDIWAKKEHYYNNYYRLFDPTATIVINPVNTDYLKWMDCANRIQIELINPFGTKGPLTIYG